MLSWEQSNAPCILYIVWVDAANLLLWSMQHTSVLLHMQGTLITTVCRIISVGYYSLHSYGWWLTCKLVLYPLIRLYLFSYSEWQNSYHLKNSIVIFIKLNIYAWRNQINKLIDCSFHLVQTIVQQCNMCMNV
jgi:hypothetical protein